MGAYIPNKTVNCHFYTLVFHLYGKYESGVTPLM